MRMIEKVCRRSRVMDICDTCFPGPFTHLCEVVTYRNTVQVFDENKM